MPTLAEALRFAGDPATTEAQLRRACELLHLDASGDPEALRSRLLARLATLAPDQSVACLNPRLIQPSPAAGALALKIAELVRTEQSRDANLSSRDLSDALNHSRDLLGADASNNAQAEPDGEPPGTNLNGTPSPADAETGSRETELQHEPQLHDDLDAPGLFRHEVVIKREDIDVLAGLRPAEDLVFQHLLGEALQGRVPVYRVAVPLQLIEVHDRNYHPENHPVGRAAIERAYQQGLAGELSVFWLYPRGDKYVLSDNYIAYAAALRGKPDLVRSLVLGEVCLPGARTLKGPLSVQEIRDSLGWG